jgi:membrane complex biogenesis BtpA family protein
VVGEVVTDRRGTMRGRFGAPRALIGMLHLEALPGSPGASLDVAAITEKAVREARIYRDAGFHAVMIENMHDRPYLKGAVGPEVVAAMAVIGREVRREVALPLGVQVLAGANREAIAVAHASGAAFVRVEGFVFAHVADEGVIEASAGDLLRYRRAIGAEPVLVLADVKKKHAAHAVTADVDVVETARAAEFFLADGVIVTGPSTGRAADPREVAAVADAIGVPTLVGSGVTPENLGRFESADGFIVGSAVKVGGLWSNAIDPASVQDFATALEKLGARV